MEQGPYSNFKCPVCNYTLRTRYQVARCSNDGCDWQVMDSVADDLTMQPTPRSASGLDAALVTIGSMVGLFFLFSYVYKAYLLALS